MKFSYNKTASRTLGREAILFLCPVPPSREENYQVVRKKWNKTNHHYGETEDAETKESQLDLTPREEIISAELIWCWHA